MKKIAIPLLAGMVFCCTQASAQKVEFKEHITKEFTVKNSNSVLAIYNLNGFIKVEGYSGDKVVLEIDKKITSQDAQTLEQGKKEFQLEMEQRGDSVIAYIAAPYDTRPDRSNRNWNDKKKLQYQYQVNFTVKVPVAIRLHVSTVNGGDVVVNDVAGDLGVYNVNGAIKVINAKGATIMRTINGNVDANFLTTPDGTSSFKTINGNISLVYPPTLSADCEYKSFNGAFYTDFPDAVPLPAVVRKNESKDENKTVYKLNKDSAIRFGKGGGTKLKFETFNGSIYIKKKV